MFPAARLLLVLGAIGAIGLGCGEHDRPVDPDGLRQAMAADREAFEDVALADVVGAAAGVPVQQAGRVLERWLAATPDARTLIDRWPRTWDGALDLDRAPVALSTVYAAIEPESRSRCGEVAAVFTGDAAPSLRVRLAIPATTPSCRGRVRASHVLGGDALPLLRAAIDAARVPPT